MPANDINTSSRQTGQGGEIADLGQNPGLEAAHLRGGGRDSVCRPPADDPPRGRVMAQTVGVVDVPIASRPNTNWRN